MHESAVMTKGFEIIGRASSAEASMSGEENQRRSAPAIYSPRTSTLVAFLSNRQFGNRVPATLICSTACTRNRTSSQDLVDPVHCSVGASFANTDGDDAIQECVCFRRGL